MRHNKKFNHLGRTASHRKAMLSNMAVSLIKHKRIATTLAKAKALRVYVEPILTKAKTDTTHSRRIVFSRLKDKYAVAELFRDVAVKIADRPGGYTRILRTGFRKGDNAEMCIIELVDYNENMLKDTSSKKSTRTRRSRRSSSNTAAKVTTTASVATKPADEKAEIVKEEDVVVEPTTAEETVEKAETTETAAVETETQTAKTAETDKEEK